MRLAIPTSCSAGHKYYRESRTDTKCPYCQQTAITCLQKRIEKMQALAALIKET